MQVWTVTVLEVVADMENNTIVLKYEVVYGLSICIWA